MRNALEANKLVEKLTLEAVTLFYLGGDPDEPEVSKLESAIRLIAEAWELSQETIDKSQETIATEREITRKVIQGEKAESVVSQDKILHGNSGLEIMSVLWALFETSVKLDTQEKREEILENAHFIADYLGLEEWISNTDPIKKQA